jgi:hypothetical protein
MIPGRWIAPIEGWIQGSIKGQEQHPQFAVCGRG